MNIEGIVLVRIDDRLIHGQVMTSWLNYTGANKIMIIDDGVAADPFMKSVLKTCVPANVRLATFTIEKAAVRLKKGFAYSIFEISVSLSSAMIRTEICDPASTSSFNICFSSSDAEIFRKNFVLVPLTPIPPILI